MNRNDRLHQFVIDRILFIDFEENFGAVFRHILKNDKIVGYFFKSHIMDRLTFVNQFYKMPEGWINESNHFCIGI